MTTSKSPASNPDFNTLLLSADRGLFKHISDYFSLNELDRTLKCSLDISDLQPIEVWLGKCDVMICDLRSDCSLLEPASLLVETAPIQLLAIGLCNGTHEHHEVLSSNNGVRLTDIVNVQDGWKGIWRHISSIKNTWNNPLMMSKIEDVPVSDILQMISIGRWNSMVQIQGRATLSKEFSKGNIERIRGSIVFWNGEPLAAWSSLHTGVQAICDLLSLKQGILKVIRPLKAPPFRNIKTDMQDILISYAVTLDESLRHPETQPAVHDREEPAPIQPSGVMHPLWSHDLTPLCETLTHAEPRSLPLRWMKTNDLQRLALPENQSEFIVLRAPRQFLIPMLGLCAREFANNKMNEGGLPVVRLGRQEKTYLYMACLETSAICLPLNAFPCAAYASLDQVPETIKSLGEIGHPVILFLVPDIEEPMLSQIEREYAPFIHRCIFAPVLRWESIAQTLVKIISTLSDRVSGGIT